MAAQGCPEKAEGGEKKLFIQISFNAEPGGLSGPRAKAPPGNAGRSAGSSCPHRAVAPDHEPSPAPLRTSAL